MLGNVAVDTGKLALDGRDAAINGCEPLLRITETFFGDFYNVAEFILVGFAFAINGAFANLARAFNAPFFSHCENTLGVELLLLLFDIALCFRKCVGQRRSFGLQSRQFIRNRLFLVD
jgi:hypothetical protein